MNYLWLVALLGVGVFGTTVAVNPPSRPTPGDLKPSRVVEKNTHASRDLPSTESWIDFPPILLPETVAPTLGVGSRGGEVIFSFIVDTLGRVELGSVDTYSAPDSAFALAARAKLPSVRYIPARAVQQGTDCVRIDGHLRHCAGPTPTIRKLRARVLLRIESQRAQAHR